MKKGLLILVLTTIVAGGVFAQKSSTPTTQTPSQGSGSQSAQKAATPAQSSTVPKNWFSGEVSILGLGARYERMLSDKMSIGGNLYFDTLFLLWYDFGADFSFRFYPWGGNGSAAEGLFFGGALGFHINWDIVDVLLSDSAFDNPLYGAAITPEVGWRLDVGSPGGFFIEPGIKIPVILGMRKEWVWVSDYWYGHLEEKNKFHVTWTTIPYFGLGVAF
jgi:hypothetical protein